MIKFNETKFILTATMPKHWPRLVNGSGCELPEVAVAGRSNVGKSSLLNTLFRRKKMVKTSSTPGKTQAINFFTVDEEVSFVDLPGYGFAKVPLSVRKKWGPMVQTYLAKRDTLNVMLLLFDIRREPKEDEHELIEWADRQNLPIILVLTKEDKIKKREKKLKVERILDLLEWSDRPYTLFSSVKKTGRERLIDILAPFVES